MIEVGTVWRRPNQTTLDAWLSWQPGKDKKCRDCWRTLPISEYHVHTRWPCGLPRLWHSYCKDCQRERTRFYARMRRRRQGIPERPGGPYRIRRGWHESGYEDRVPIEPFMHWLQAHVNRLDGQSAYFKDPVGGVEIVARECHVDPERIRRIVQNRSGQKHVTLGLVDRVLIGTGSSTQLWELYPDDDDQTDVPGEAEGEPQRQARLAGQDRGAQAA